MKKFLGVLSIVAAIFVIASCNLPVGSQIETGTVADKDINGKKIVAYLPDWSANISSVQWDKLTHVNYSFAFPTAEGGLSGINAGILNDMVSTAHANGVMALVAIGGWDIGDGGGVDTKFHNIASDSALLATFVNNVMSMVAQYNLDGVDIDWEHPSTAAEKESYAVFMKELAIALHAEGKLLTTALACDGTTPNYIKSEVFGYTDFVNLMAYDGAPDNHSPYSYAVSSLDTYVTQKGLPADKAILGVPFYGRRSWSDAATYKALLSQGADPNADVHDGYYYNGITTIKQKTQLAIERAGGVMFWEISQDVNDERSLLSAIYNEIKAINPGTPTPTPTIDPNFTPSPTPTATPVPPCLLEDWNSATAYVGGNEVHHNGFNWRAKWWTQNEEPGVTTSGVWENIGECGGVDVTPTPTFTATPTNTATPIVTPTNTATPFPPTPTPTATPTTTAYLYLNIDAPVKSNVTVQVIGGSLGSHHAYDYVVMGGSGSSVNVIVDSEYYTFENWSGNVSGTNKSVSVLLGGIKEATAHFSAGSTPTPTPTSGAYPAWSASDVYVGGDIVTHNGQNWKAEWWTTGEEPGTTGEWGVWRSL